MKFTIKFSDVNDPHHLPWDMVVADTRHSDVLTVQEPHPHAGANLIGFETEPMECDLTVHHDGWTDQAVGKFPVFAEKGGMYSLRGFQVRGVEEEE